MVLANRLSEIPDFRVLVLEAGPEPTVVRNYESPGGNQFLGGTAIDWNFYTTPQEHIGGRTLFYRRKSLPAHELMLTGSQAARLLGVVRQPTACSTVGVPRASTTTGLSLATPAGPGKTFTRSLSRLG